MEGKKFTLLPGSRCFSLISEFHGTTTVSHIHLSNLLPSNQPLCIELVQSVQREKFDD